MYTIRYTTFHTSKIIMRKHFCMRNFEIYRVFNSSHTLYWHHNKVSVLTHDFQHITKNCQTQYSLRCVENHVEELINYCDANTPLKTVEKHLARNEKRC